MPPLMSRMFYKDSILSVLLISAGLFGGGGVIFYVKADHQREFKIIFALLTLLFLSLLFAWRLFPMNVVSCGADVQGRWVIWKRKLFIFLLLCNKYFQLHRHDNGDSVVGTNVLLWSLTSKTSSVSVMYHTVSPLSMRIPDARKYREFSKSVHKVDDQIERRFMSFVT